MQRIDILDADCQVVIENVDRQIARGIVADGGAVWIEGRPAIRLLRNFYELRDRSANPGPTLIEANADGKSAAQAITEAWSIDSVHRANPCKPD